MKILKYSVIHFYPNLSVNANIVAIGRCRQSRNRTTGRAASVTVSVTASSLDMNPQNNVGDSRAEEKRAGEKQCHFQT